MSARVAESEEERVGWRGRASEVLWLVLWGKEEIGCTLLVVDYTISEKEAPKMNNGVWSRDRQIA
jgi:hypothetical protein